MSNLYDDDIVLWSERQAELLRQHAAAARWNDQIDWPNIIDEVETVGRSERAALRSHIAVVLEHLIKLLASSAADPRNGWKTSIRRARIAIERDLDDSPSLRQAVAGMVQDETLRSRKYVMGSLKDYGEQPLLAIDSLTFTDDQVLGDWFPGDGP